MATWTTFDASDSPFIQASTALLNTAGPFLTGASAAATAAAIALKAAALLGTFTPSLNPEDAAIKTFKGAVDALIDGLTNTGLFTLVINPDVRERSGQTGLEGFVRTIKNYFVDPSDVNKPVFGAGDTAEGLICLVSSPDLDALSNLAEGFQIFFGEAWQELIDSVNLPNTVVPVNIIETSGVVTSIPDGANPKQTFVDETQGPALVGTTLDPYKNQRMTMMSGRNTGLSTRVGSFDTPSLTYTMSPRFRYELQEGDTYVLSHVTTPSPPDWRSLRTVDVVPVVAVVSEILKDFRDLLPDTGMSAFQSLLVDQLERKAELYTELEARISDVIALFNAFANVPTMSFLAVPAQTLGNDGFTDEVFKASDPPNIGDDDHTLGIVLYGGTGVLNILGKIFPS